MWANLSFARRLSLMLALLLCGFGLLASLLARQLLVGQERENLQSLSRGLARHIVEHWPVVSQRPTGIAERQALNEVLGMLMVVNPAIEVYVLDGQGQVSAYLGDPKAVLRRQIDLGPVRAFLSGSPLPLLGTDPKAAPDAPQVGKIFSAALFPPQSGEGRPIGYLYVVLEGEAHSQLAGQGDQRALWQNLALLLGLALALTLLLGLGLMRRLTRPLRELARRMQAFGPGATSDGRTAPGGDEVRAIGQAFDAMATRIDEQLRQKAEQQATHREVVLNVAHDLRTPLTALHGHLEALQEGVETPSLRQHHLGIALAQSNRVRRLSQQLFELASLQSAHQIVHVERFRLDEVVSDAVQKFSYGAHPAAVALVGPAPGPLELEGDLQLIDRALTNLIDNALRHAPSTEPVRVSLECAPRQITVLVEDHGPGLPQELSRRLDQGLALRDPPLLRPGGGFGGLGLAIVQRIAALHGGRLSVRATPHGGSLLCLALPRAASPSN